MYEIEPFPYDYNFETVTCINSNYHHMPEINLSRKTLSIMDDRKQKQNQKHNTSPRASSQPAGLAPLLGNWLRDNVQNSKLSSIHKILKKNI